MTCKVSVSFGNIYPVKVSESPKVKANIIYELNDLQGVTITGNQSNKVSVSFENIYPVKVSESPKVKANISYKFPMNLNDLQDVTITGNPSNYVLMYDSTLGQWVNKNPDDLLTAAVIDTTPGNEGLPDQFINQLDVDLDNKIDLDAGTF